MAIQDEVYFSHKFLDISLSLIRDYSISNRCIDHGQRRYEDKGNIGLAEGGMALWVNGRNKRTNFSSNVIYSRCPTLYSLQLTQFLSSFLHTCIENAIKDPFYIPIKHPGKYIYWRLVNVMDIGYENPKLSLASFISSYEIKSTQSLPHLIPWQDSCQYVMIYFSRDCLI